MRKILLQQNYLLANIQNKPQKVSSRILIMPNTSLPYPVFFEIEGGGGNFGDEDEMDPDDMSDVWFRRRLRESGKI